MVLQHIFAGVQTTRIQVGFMACLVTCCVGLYVYNKPPTLSIDVQRSQATSHLSSINGEDHIDEDKLRHKTRQRPRTDGKDFIKTTTGSIKEDIDLTTKRAIEYHAKRVSRKSKGVTKEQPEENFQHVKKVDKTIVTLKENENDKHSTKVNKTIALGVDQHRNPGKSDLSYDVLMAQRSIHFKEVCETLAYVHSKSNAQLSLTYLKDYNLGLKFTAKVGTTFLLQMILVLNSSGKISDSIFTKARSNLHQMPSLRKAKTFDQSSIRHTTAVLFARNPISRLYSAYIDKVFLMNSPELVRDVVTFNQGMFAMRSCPVDVTFQEFINYALNSPSKIIDDHYGPISGRIVLPVVCKATDLVIVKGESYSPDVEYVLEKIHAENNKRQVLHDALHSKRTKTTVVGIIKTMCAKYRLIKTRLRCGDWTFLTQRLWKSFQIQGYIDTSRKFPSSQIPRANTKNFCQNTLQVFLNEIRTHPLSSVRSSFQRSSALVNAYKGVSASYIRQIFDTYDTDFRLFDYDKEVPY